MSTKTKDRVAEFVYRVCIGCACHDFHACINKDGQACYWERTDPNVKLGVCSECTAHLDRWDAGDRNFSKKAEEVLALHDDEANQ